MVNAIPAKATLESYVRGKTFDAMRKVNQKVNQALVGAALSIGTNIEIIDAPGYAPTVHNEAMNAVMQEAVALQLPQYECKAHYGTATGSTDMGDLSSIMPVIHPNCPGAKGVGHSMDFYIVDPVAACVDCAKAQLAMLSLLLRDGGARAKQIVDAYKPQFASKTEYFAFVDGLNDSGDRIVYTEDGVASVRVDK